MDAVSSPDWYPYYQRQDAPPKNRLSDPLSVLPYVAVSAIGNRIGSITYMISGAVHAGQIDKVALLSAALQAEVQSLKWDTRADRTVFDDTEIKIPDFLSNSKTDKKLFVDYADKLNDDTPLIRNYNRVVNAWKKASNSARPLLEFKPLVPIWLEPASLDKVEETAAVIQMFNRWIASILDKNPDPSQAELEGPIAMLQTWDESKTEERKSWAVSLWHVVHGTRIERSTGSAAFHAFSQELVDIISNNRDQSQITVPESNRSLLSDFNDLSPVIPLVGAVRASEESGTTLSAMLREISHSVSVETRQNGDVNAAFFTGDNYIGQIPKDHLLFGSVPIGLKFEARLQKRGRTIYLVPSTPDWLISIQS